MEDFLTVNFDPVHALTYMMLGFGMLSGCLSMFIEKREDKIAVQLHSIISLLGAAVLKYLVW